MRKILNIANDEIVPPLQAIFGAQGIPGRVKPDERTQNLARDAISRFKELCAPVAVFDEIGKEGLRSVFDASGKNQVESPVRPIFESADHLALFALTLGEHLCLEISRRFREHDYAQATMLDAVASEAAEMAADVLESNYKQFLVDRGIYHSQHRILRFSPGYCGWDLSGQQQLFGYLQPIEIGISLNKSFLMNPIKSISGIMIGGDRHIFEFDDTFSFCRDCTTHTCRERIRALEK